MNMELFLFSRCGPNPAKPLFDHIKFWVFDLDNTLYPASSSLFSQIDIRMGKFIADHFNLSAENAYRLQKKYYREHGTTLRGLMDLHDVDPIEFLDYVHDIDYQVLKPSPELGEILRILPGKKVVFTNGDRNHAGRVLDRLGVRDCFDGVFDIVAANFIPKPEKASYEAMMKTLHIEGDKAAMFEDMACNLVPAHAIGMTTILVCDPMVSPKFPEGDIPWVDCVVDDLPALLRSLS